MSSAPMYRIPMTAAQMAEESRKATAEGMRQIAAALAEHRQQLVASRAQRRHGVGRLRTSLGGCVDAGVEATYHAAEQG